MLYVMQIAPHEESRIEKILRAYMPKSLCRQCFHPMRKMKKKIHGEWIEVREKLLPGYVFVDTENPEEFYKNLVNIPRLTKLLGKFYNEAMMEWEFTGLSPDESLWLAKIMTCSGNGEVPLSKVKRNEKGEIQIVSGPLLYMQENVKKFDLHRRIAKVELSFRKERALVHFGIEIID